jgi:hypothetical protein
VSLLVLKKLWQQLRRTCDWQPSHWPGGRLQLLLHAAATTGVQLAFHSEGQSLHNGFSLGCPWEDMTSTVRTAMVAATLRHDPLLGVSKNPDGIPEHERKDSKHVQVQR